MRYVLAIYDSDHQAADGNFWSHRHPSLPPALLQALHDDHLTKTFNAETLTQDDLHQGVIGFGDWVCAYQIVGGSTDSRGRTGHYRVLAAFTARDFDNTTTLTAMLANNTLGDHLKTQAQNALPLALEQECRHLDPIADPDNAPGFHYSKTEQQPDNAYGDAFHAAAVAAALTNKSFHLHFQRRGDTAVTTARPVAFAKEHASIPDLTATAQAADLTATAPAADLTATAQAADRRPVRAGHLGVATIVILCLAFAWLIWQNLQFADLKRLVNARQAEDERPLAAVILVHGIGAKQHLLNVDFTAPAEIIRHVGHLSMSGDNVVCTDVALDVNPRFPCYTVSLTGNGYAAINDSAAELQAFVSEASRRSRARGVILCGYNVGAVIAREYLTNPSYESAARRQVTQLISIAAPHSGADLAKLPAKIDFLKKHPDLYAWLEKQFPAVDFESPLYQQLLPPQPGNYLWNLNQRQHPDISYACIILNPEIRTVNLIREAWNAVVNPNDSQANSWMATLGNIVGARLKASTDDAPDAGILFNDGDGVVSASSQDLSQVAFFKSKKFSGTIPTRVITDSDVSSHRIIDYLELFILARHHPIPPTATSPGR
ncbi:MAG TPA: hypothetical protein PLT23_03020 [Lentisphaeria bacterium]|nr:hypothetical protein [Lentisphaeria bacterium]